MHPTIKRYRYGSWFIEKVDGGIRTRYGEPCGRCFGYGGLRGCRRHGDPLYDSQIWLYNEKGNNELRLVQNTSLCLVDPWGYDECDGGDAQMWFFKSIQEFKDESGFKIGKPDEWIYITPKEDEEYCLQGGPWVQEPVLLLPCDDNDARMRWTFNESHGYLRARDNLSICLFVNKAKAGEMATETGCAEPEVHPFRKMSWQYNKHGNREISLIVRDSLCLTNEWVHADVLKSGRMRIRSSFRVPPESRVGVLKLAGCNGRRDQMFNFIDAIEPNAENFASIILTEKPGYCIWGFRWHVELLPCDSQAWNMDEWYPYSWRRNVNENKMIWVLDDVGRLKTKDDHSFCLFVSRAQPGEKLRFETCRPPDVHPYRKMNWQYNVYGDREISLVAKDHLCIKSDWSGQEGAGELRLAKCSGIGDQKYNL